MNFRQRHSISYRITQSIRNLIMHRFQNTANIAIYLAPRAAIPSKGMPSYHEAICEYSLLILITHSDKNVTNGIRVEILYENQMLDAFEGFYLVEYTIDQHTKH